jgi:hypothetical protein
VETAWENIGFLTGKERDATVLGILYYDHNLSNLFCGAAQTIKGQAQLDCVSLPPLFGRFQSKKARTKRAGLAVGQLITV